MFSIGANVLITAGRNSGCRAKILAKCNDLYLCSVKRIRRNRVWHLRQLIASDDLFELKFDGWL